VQPKLNRLTFFLLHGLVKMIDSNFSSLKASTVGLSGARDVAFSARNTFQSLISQLDARPLKPLAIQPFGGSSQRNLDQQVRSDTTL
jgi:hypothetical protein